MPSRPNLASIARTAGVSVPTVSKVIHGRTGVAESTRRRVLEIIDATGYQSPTERRLRSSGPALVDLVIGDLRDTYATMVLHGILEHARNSNVDVAISSVQSDLMHLHDADEWARRMVESGRTGLIAVTSHMTVEQHAAFVARGIPMVVIDPINTPDAELPSVGSTNWAGGKAAIDHLIELGHERIAFLGGPASAECNQARMHGYLASLMAHDIRMQPDYVRHGERFHRTAGVACARQLLALPQPPTAIFAASDSLALGVLEVARERGLDVPRDLSVVGFDGLPIVEQTLPRLTSVSQPLTDIGRTALRTLLALANGSTTEAPRVELATELVVRGSTAPPHGG
ncbi:LacI family DNA-binding transcriptional regulator [Microbacterium sp. YY-01]|uniref:LacI family DNA-binding transcriptional regulator n=1 Tax=Microbacterium sp. YY-01 TaxID=3421634 RepID=UPI003D16D081